MTHKYFFLFKLHLKSLKQASYSYQFTQPRTSCTLLGTNSLTGEGKRPQKYPHISSAPLTLLDDEIIRLNAIVVST